MLAPAVGEAFDQGRAFAGPRARDRFLDHVIDLDGVVAVDGHAGHLIADGAVGYLRRRRRTPVGRAEGVLVVLADEQDRQFPDRGEIHRLVEDTLVRGAVAEERDDDLVGAAQLRGQRRAGAERHRRADDSVRAQNVEVQVGDMHRAAEATAITGVAAQQFGHHAVEVGALGDAVAVASMVAGHVIVVAQDRADGRGDRLLADVAVRGALDQPFLEQVGGALLERANAPHRRVNFLELLGGKGEVRSVAFRRPRRRHAKLPACLPLPGSLATSRGPGHCLRLLRREQNVQKHNGGRWPANLPKRPHGGNGSRLDSAYGAPGRECKMVMGANDGLERTD